MKIDTSKLVKGPELLEALFAPDGRPTMRWLRDQTKARVIPHYKIGHYVYFDVDKVRAALEKHNLLRSL